MASPSSKFRHDPTLMDLVPKDCEILSRLGGAWWGDPTADPSTLVTCCSSGLIITVLSPAHDDAHISSPSSSSVTWTQTKINWEGKTRPPPPAHNRLLTSVRRLCGLAPLLVKRGLNVFAPTRQKTIRNIFFPPPSHETY